MGQAALAADCATIAPVSREWVKVFRTIHYRSAPFRMGPSEFDFKDDQVTIGVSAGKAQQAANELKRYLEIANSDYLEHAERQQRAPAFPALPPGKPVDLQKELIRREARWVDLGGRVTMPGADLELLLLDRARWKAWALALEEAGAWKEK